MIQSSLAAEARIGAAVQSGHPTLISVRIDFTDGSLSLELHQLRLAHGLRTRRPEVR